jgi:hypothetical protein
MDDKDVFLRVSDLLNDYLKPLGMMRDRGPLRVLRELTHGIVFTGSVQLSNAVRLWARDAGQLRHGVERLSEGLADRHRDHREWAAGVLRLSSEEIEEDDLIPIDATELAKPYARCMQYQSTIRDASRVGDPLVAGYWCFGAYHWQADQACLAPLMLRPYSSRQPDFESENTSFSRWFWALREATAGRGIWLMDRGGDRPSILADLLRVQPRWIIRLRGDRGLIGPDGTRRPANACAEWALQHATERERAVTVPVHLPPADVTQYGQPAPLWLVVPTYTLGAGERLLLLTCGLVDRQTELRSIRYDYALRWRAEDGKRLLGQIWHVERFLTRSFLALERMLWCVVLAGGFVAMLQRDHPRWRDRLERRVLYHAKDFKILGYRLARGLQAVAIHSGRMTMLNNA